MSSNISSLAAIDFLIFPVKVGIGTWFVVALAGAGVVPGLKKLALCLLIGDIRIQMVGGVGVYREGDNEEDDGVGIDQGIAN